MNIPIFLLILSLGHVLGDFYFQWNHMAEMKKTSFKWLFFHGVVYAACIALAISSLVLFGGVTHSPKLLWILILISISHMIIDFCKTRTVLGNKKWSFVIDQAAHLGVLLFAWLLWGKELAIGCYIYDYAHHITIILGLLFIIRPVGLLLEEDAIWSFDMNQSNPHQKNASRVIGYLERIIVFFLLLHGQYSAIALVIAAKSIARFPEIKDEKSHMQANHYIIGTFISLTAVIFVTVLLNLTS